jgi:predicted acyltransferase
MEGCLSSYIDQQLIPGTLYYGHVENEGLISTLPATRTVLLGALAGYWLRSDRPGNRKAAGLARAGAATHSGLCALVLPLGVVLALVVPVST